MWGKALFAILLAVGIFFCITPPFSDTVSFYVSEYYPPARANKFVSLSRGMITGMAIQAGAKMGLFNHLQTPATYKQVASDLKVDERGVHILLNSLVSSDILAYDSSSGKYSLTSGAATHLIPSKPNYIGFFFQLLGGQVSRLSRLDEIVKAGGASFLEDSADTPNHPFWEIFANITIQGSRQSAQAMAKTISGWAEGRKELRVLDIAAGSGTYGYTFAQTYPNARVTFLDWPNVVPLTEKNIVEFPGVKKEQATFLPGDAFKSDLNGPYDVVLVSHFYHHFSIERNIELTRRFAQALKPDGKLIVNEFLATDPPERSNMGNGFALMMLAWTSDGEAFRANDYDHILKTAGLNKVEHVGNFPFPNSFVVASR